MCVVKYCMKIKKKKKVFIVVSDSVSCLQGFEKNHDAAKTTSCLVPWYSVVKERIPVFSAEQKQFQ